MRLNDRQTVLHFFFFFFIAAQIFRAASVWRIVNLDKLGRVTGFPLNFHSFTA